MAVPDSTICKDRAVLLEVLIYGAGPSGCDNPQDYDFDYKWNDGTVTTENILTTAILTQTTTFSVEVINAANNVQIFGSAVVTVNVTSPIDINIGGIGPFCDDDDPMNLNDFLSQEARDLNGDWSGPGVIGDEFHPDVSNINPPNTVAVTYTADNGACGIESISANITVNRRPNISFGPTIQLCESNNQVDLFDYVTVNGSNTTSGTFSPQSIPQLSNNLFRPSVPGTYQITYSLGGSCPKSASATINVSQEAIPTVTIDSPACLMDADYDITVEPGGGTFGVVSIPPGATIDDALDAISEQEFEPNELSISGTYVYSYTVGGDCGGTNNNISVVVNKNPTPTIMPTPSSVCLEGDPVALNVNISGGIFTGIGVTGNTFDPSSAAVVSMGAGDYIINYEVEQNGCKGSDNAKVTVLPLPDADIEFSPSRLCEGGDVSVETINDSEVTTWLWTKPDGSTDTGQKLGINNVSINDDGEYHVVFENANGCKGEANGELTVFADPIMNIEGPTAACSDGMITLKLNHSSGPGTPQYQWSKDEGGGMGFVNIDNTKQITTTVSSNTKFKVILSFVDANEVIISGCGPDDLDDFKVSVVATPTPQIEAFGVPNYCSGGTTIFFNNDRRMGSTQQWSLIHAPNTEQHTSYTLGNFYVVHWDGTDLSPDVRLTETAGDNCFGGDRINDIDIQGASPPRLAEIFYSPINNTLIYNDSTVCYQWGYIDTVLNEIDTLQGEIYQAYVAGDTYDKNRVYFCRVSDCGNADCSTTALHRFATSPEEPTEEEQPEKIILYPNPNDGNFILDVNKLVPDVSYDLVVRNVLGQIVHQESITTIDDEINTSIQMKNNAGVYYLILMRKNKIYDTIPFVILQP